MNARTNKRGHRDFIHGVEVLLARGQGHADGKLERAKTVGRRTSRVVWAAMGTMAACLALLIGAHRWSEVESLPGAGLHVAQSIEVGPAMRGLVVALVSTGDLVGNFAGDAEGTAADASNSSGKGLSR
jgi:hypothetical protein